jgi:hypothetical protein
MPRNLSGSIALSKIKHVLMTANGKEGPVEGMFIPFVANKLTVIKKMDETDKTKVKEVQVYMPANVHIKDEEDQNSQIGFISKTLSSDDYKALGKGDVAKAAAAEFTPILGSLKEFKKGSNSNDAEGNVAEGGKTFTPTDDLPF